LPLCGVMWSTTSAIENMPCWWHIEHSGYCCNCSFL